MQGIVINIEKAVEENENFREVVFTAPHSQLVLMSLEPKEDIGLEVHSVDQFIKIESGEGKAILDGEEIEIEGGFAVVIPAGAEHNIINSSSESKMKLYTVYSPAEHKDGTVHTSKAEAEAAEKEDE
ncbi:MAG: cupin domain-containing protein [Patescibacteria group bacterium]